MKKIISLLLVAAMAVSVVPMALATTNYTNGTQVEYTATGSEAYTITVPAQLAPSGSGTVTLSGTWASDRKVTVTANETVTLTNSINANDKHTLDITFAGISKAGDNTQSRTYTETVSVAAMPADALFGTWSGTFYYNVEVGAAVEMISFTYQGIPLQARSGMTWGEWAESEYNTYEGDATCSGSHTTRIDFSPSGLLSEICNVEGSIWSIDISYCHNNTVSAGDTITDGADYVRCKF